MKDIKKYDELKNNYNSFIDSLEEIAEERHEKQRKLTRNLLKQVLENKIKSHKLELIDNLLYLRLHYYYKR